MTSQMQTSGQRRDTQVISQNKDYTSIQAELESWFIINSARHSNENTQLLKVWHIFTARLKYCEKYPDTANYLYNCNIITQQEREAVNNIYLKARIVDTEPHTLEEELLSIY